MAKPAEPHDSRTADRRREQSGGKEDASSQRRRDNREREQETSGGEDMSGEGSPGLTITGGGGHA